MLKGKRTQQAVVINNYMARGLFDVKPVAVNPTQDELKKLGKSGNREPQYVFPAEGDKTKVHRMQIYHAWEFNGHKFCQPVSFRLTEDPIYSTDKGTYLYTNNKGEFTWAKDIDDIKEKNENAPEDKPYMKFAIEKKYNPRIAFKGEVSLTNYLISLSGYNTRDPEFEIDVRSYWDKNIMDGDVSEFKADIANFNKLRVLVMIDQARQAMEIFSKESMIAQNPFLRDGVVPHAAHPFTRYLFDLQKDSKGKYSIPGPYSMAEKYDISFTPELVERSMPDISAFTSRPEEQEDEYSPSESSSMESGDGLPF